MYESITYSIVIIVTICADVISDAIISDAIICDVIICDVIICDVIVVLGVNVNFDYSFQEMNKKRSGQFPYAPFQEG